MKSIYLIGALKNWDIPVIANEIQELGIEAFCDWISPGPDADKYLLQLAKARGWNYEQLLNSHAANHCFQFDLENLNRVDAAVAIAPFGKSAFAELGYMAGKGKPAYVLFPNGPELPERFDLMIKFATKVFFDKKTFYDHLKANRPKTRVEMAIEYAVALEDRQSKCEHKFFEMKIRIEPYIFAPQEVCQKCQFRRWKPGGIINVLGDPGNITLPALNNTPQWSASYRFRCSAKHTWVYGETSQCQLFAGHARNDRDEGHKFSPSDTVPKELPRKVRQG